MCALKITLGKCAWTENHIDSMCALKYLTKNKQTNKQTKRNKTRQDPSKQTM